MVAQEESEHRQMRRLAQLDFYMPPLQHSLQFSDFSLQVIKYNYTCLLFQSTKNILRNIHKLCTI
jgi:hypothetical protein